MYYVDNSSLYVKILKIRHRSATHLKAHVQYFSRPGGTFLSEERNCKIPLKCFTFWKTAKG